MNENTLNVNWRGGLPQLVAELDRQKKSRIDFVADTSTVTINPSDVDGGEEPGLHLSAGEDRQLGEFLTNPHRLSDRALDQLDQLGERVDPVIPGKYLRALSRALPNTAAALLRNQLKHTNSRVLFRCLDGKVRACLSNKYRIFDDLDIAINCLGTIKDKQGTVIECTASESRFEIKFTALYMVEHVHESRGGTGAEKHIRRSTLDPSQFKHLGKGAVCPFVKVSHSSVGEGGLGIGTGLLRLECINGAVSDTMMNQVHLGAATNLGLLTEETIAADSKAIMLKARDLIAASLNPETFKRAVSIAKAASADVISAPSTAVNNLVQNCGLTDSAKEAILQHFLRDYDSTRWGLAQAVSRYSQDLDDAASFESLSGKLVAGNSLLLATKP